MSICLYDWVQLSIYHCILYTGALFVMYFIAMSIYEYVNLLCLDMYLDKHEHIVKTEVLVPMILV